VNAATRFPAGPRPRGYVLRLAAPSDAGGIAELHVSRVPSGWSAAGICALLNQRHVFAHIAETRTGGTDVAGAVIARAAGGEAEILSLVTARDHEGRGVGGALARLACAGAARRGAGEMFLEVAAANVAALRLYRRLGFREIGRRPRYYGPREADGAIVLGRGLTAPVDGRSAGS
jgi:ribosomal-protein-alanine N-acetyltransferase